MTMAVVVEALVVVVVVAVAQIGRRSAEVDRLCLKSGVCQFMDSAEASTSAKLGHVPMFFSELTV